MFKTIWRWLFPPPVVPVTAVVPRLSFPLPEGVSESELMAAVFHCYATTALPHEITNEEK